MRSFADQPRTSSYMAGPGPHEPGAELPFPDCGCPAPPLGIDAVRFLTEVQLVTVLDAARVACLHRCPGWPRRRSEAVVVRSPIPVTDLE